MLDRAQLTRWAEILVNYSTAVQEGEVVDLWCGSEEAKPLYLAVYRELLRRNPREIVPRFSFEEPTKILYQEGPESYLDRFPELAMHVAERTDVRIQIRAPRNTRHLSNTEPARMARRARTVKPFLDLVLERLRWVLTDYPTRAAAQEADMSLEEWERFVFAAVDLDWGKVAKEQERLVTRFNKGRELRIVGEETDLTLRIEGRTFVNGRGDENMPDGEFYTSPVENSASGHIAYSYPAIEGGREVEGIRLAFEDGRVVEASASKNEAFLLEMLDTDEGARYLGELGIGNNFGIDRFVKNMLFDEKIGGTVHLALGKAIPEAGGANESAIHWDMLKDLREGGEIYLDDQLIQKDGKWLI
ncbi:MAG: aminopeptidase [Anaerolineae bacterium]